MVKVYYGRFGQKILLLVKVCIINLLLKIYMRTVQSGNIIASKKMYNQFTCKNLYANSSIR
jgi:hypothetical protein